MDLQDHIQQSSPNKKQKTNDYQVDSSRDVTSGLPRDMSGFVPMDQVFLCSAITCRIINPSYSKTATGFVMNLKNYGKPFLCVLTNHHVIPTETEAKTATLQFSYGTPKQLDLALDPERLFFANKNYDYCVIALQRNTEILHNNDHFEVIDLPLPDRNPKQLPQAGDQVYIFQYPRGEKQQMCGGQLTAVNKHMLRYNVTTLPGSSGSPIFDCKTAKIIGIHSARLDRSIGKLGYSLQHIEQDLFAQLNPPSILSLPEISEMESANGMWSFHGTASPYYALEWYFDGQHEASKFDSYDPNGFIQLKIKLVAGRPINLKISNARNQPGLDLYENVVDICFKISINSKCYFYLTSRGEDTSFTFEASSHIATSTSFQDKRRVESF